MNPYAAASLRDSQSEYITASFRRIGDRDIATCPGQWTDVVRAVESWLTFAKLAEAKP